MALVPNHTTIKKAIPLLPAWPAFEFVWRVIDRIDKVDTVISLPQTVSSIAAFLSNSKVAGVIMAGSMALVWFMEQQHPAAPLYTSQGSLYTKGPYRRLWIKGLVGGFLAAICVYGVARWNFQQQTRAHLQKVYTPFHQTYMENATKLGAPSDAWSQPSLVEQHEHTAATILWFSTPNRRAYFLNKADGTFIATSDPISLNNEDYKEDNARKELAAWKCEHGGKFWPLNGIQKIILRDKHLWEWKSCPIGDEPEARACFHYKMGLSYFQYKMSLNGREAAMLDVDHPHGAGEADELGRDPSVSCSQRGAPVCRQESSGSV